MAKVLEFQLQQSVLPINIQDWFPLRWTALIPFSPRDSQEFSPTPQFKSINSSALSFLYTPTLTSIHDYWKNHSTTFIVHFISNAMPLLIWWEVPTGLWSRGWGPLLQNIIAMLKIISMRGKSLDMQIIKLQSIKLPCLYINKDRKHIWKDWVQLNYFHRCPQEENRLRLKNSDLEWI